MSLLAPAPADTTRPVPPAAPRRPAAAPRRPAAWLALPVLLAAVFMTTLDFFIASAAAPAIRAELGGGPATGQAVPVAYGLAYAAALITAGRLGDLLGPRRVFAWGLALFTAASVACGLAPGTGVLVGGRVAQGLGAALMGPQVLALISVLFPGPKRAKAFAWYGTTVGIAGTGGQAAGGLVVALDPAGLGWRTCFLVNVPLGLAALALTPALLPEGRGGRTTAAALDVPGAALSAAALLALVVPLVMGLEVWRPGWMWPSLALSVLLVGVFVAQQRRRTGAGRPALVDPAVFRERGFVGGLVAVALLFGGSAGLTYVLAVYLQEGRGMSALAAGAVSGALNAGFLAASSPSGRLTGRFGARLPVGGALVLTAGLVLVGRTAPSAAPGAVPLGLVAGLAVAGAGMGLVMAPVTASALAHVRPRLAGTAAGVLGTVQETAGVLGITVIGLVFFEASARSGPDPGTGSGAWDTAFRAAVTALALGAFTLAAVAARNARRAAADAGDREPPPKSVSRRPHPID